MMMNALSHRSSVIAAVVFVVVAAAVVSATLVTATDDAVAVAVADVGRQVVSVNASGKFNAINSLSIPKPMPTTITTKPTRKLTTINITLNNYEQRKLYKPQQKWQSVKQNSPQQSPQQLKPQSPSQSPSQQREFNSLADIISTTTENSLIDSFSTLVFNETTIVDEVTITTIATTVAVIDNNDGINKNNKNDNKKTNNKPLTIEEILKGLHGATIDSDGDGVVDNEDEDERDGANGDFDIIPDCDPYNPHFNCSREKFVEYCQGPQRLPTINIIVITIIFGGIFLTGVLGNVLVCVVIMKHSAMHTATNYYLFSLAVSDLIYLIFGLPADVFIYWHQYPYLFGLSFCKIRAFISEASTYVSVLTIVAFSMERFLAICHPLHLYAMSGFKRAIRIIATLWIISLISAVPFGVATSIRYLSYPPDNSIIELSAFCAMDDSIEYFPVFELSFCIFFVIPMILIIMLYGRMGIQIKYTTTQQLGVQQGSMHRESRHQQSRKAVIRMLAAVVITFFICWLPFHIQRLWYLYAKQHDYYQEINEWLFSITGFTYYISCTINPILYNVMSHRYRVAFKDILCGKRRAVYYHNGFAREQSSFRETPLGSTGGGGGFGGGGTGGSGTYNRGQSVRRVRSVRHVNNAKDPMKSNNTLWTMKNDFNAPRQKIVTEIPPVLPPPPQSSTVGQNLVVVVDHNVNGRPKVYTENEAQETLINKSKETSI